jgi:Tfp pilus assembly protein PilN
MPSINLIATRREEKRRLEQHIRRLIWAIVTEFGVIILVASLMVAKIVNEHGQIAQLDGQIGLMQGKVDEIQFLASETSGLKPKVGILNGARNNTLYWYTALQTIVACLPEQSWLTNIGTSGDPSTGAAPPAKGAGQKPAPAPSGPNPLSPGLTLAGQAVDSDQVGLAMQNMNRFANINTVTLGSVTSSSAANGAKTMTFSMTVQLKPNTASETATPNPGQGPLPQAAPTTATAPKMTVGSPVRQAAVVAPAATGEVNHA